MAYIFELAAECAEDKEAAENIANFFKDSTITLSNGTKIKLGISVAQSEHNWWCTVEPEGVSRTGATARITTIAQIVEVLEALYNHLRPCTGFRIALVGWEPVTQLNIREILEGKLIPADIPVGSVVSNKVWQQIGCPSEMTKFGEATRWKAPAKDQFHEMARLFSSDT